MAITATITVELDVPSEFIAKRDAFAAEIDAWRKAAPDGCYVAAPDFHAWDWANKALNSLSGSGLAQARDVAKKAGLTVERELASGIHGSWSGPVTFWYQIRCKG